MRANSILQLALPTPLNRLFDYLPPNGVDAAQLRPGQRLRVPFGRRRLTGVLVAQGGDSAVPAVKLKRALALLDEAPLVPGPLLQLLQWAWRYYHHAPGEVVAACLPAPLRQGRAVADLLPRVWRLTIDGLRVDPATLNRAPRQSEVLRVLAEGPLDSETLDHKAPGWRHAMAALRQKGWVTRESGTPLPVLETTMQTGAMGPPELNAEQSDAVASIRDAQGRFQAFLLQGVAGSGKTEVYLKAIEAQLDAGRQCLVIVPEIGLTPQLLGRFQRRLETRVAVLHSGLGDTERARAWLAARDGEAGVVLGTRSAIFTPLAKPGLIVVDEEHDTSLKQQEGFRYSARDLALVRGRKSSIPVVLGSATPSLESLHNAKQGRYRRLSLPARAGGASPPRVALLDIRGRAMVEGLSDRLFQSMETHLGRDEQVLLFLNRRGFAPVMLCHDCGWHARCERCDAHLTCHRGRGILLCHHCEARRPIPSLCPECAGEAMLYGAGTERLEHALKQRFPEVPLLRIDRDTTRRRGTLDKLLMAAREPGARILVGTQMLAKGHHLPEVTLVGVVNIDQMLFSADFRAAERLAQLMIQVAGRSGRAAKPGTVWVQTHHPDHHLLQTLLREGYPGFARAALAERRELQLPPYAHLALLRGEAMQAGAVERFLGEAKACAGAPAGLSLHGPVPAPMERRQGRYRYQLLVQSTRRRALQAFLATWASQLETLKSARQVRWSLDVDPVDLF